MDNEVDDLFIQVIGHLFVLKMTEQTKRAIGIGSKKQLSSKLLDQQFDMTQTKDVYELSVNHEKKCILLKLKYNPREGKSMREAFRKDYKKILDPLDVHDYVLEIDCTDLNIPAQYPKMQEDVNIYLYKPMQGARLVFREKQIVLAVQYKRLIENIGLKTEIIIK